MKKTTPVNIGSIRRGLITTPTIKELNAMSIPIITTVPDKIKIKACVKCGLYFPATEEFFYKRRNGLRADCKICRRKFKKEINKKWKKANPDSVKKSIEKYKQKGEIKRNKARQKKENTPEFKAKKIEKIKRKLLSKAQPTAISIVNILGLKKCTKCGEEKPNTKEFFSWRSDYANPDFSRICIDCQFKTRQVFGLSKAKYNNAQFKTLKTFEETRKDPTNPTLGQVKCAYCGKWINPTYSEIKGRMQSFNNVNLGECRIYCPGDQCREACPTYQQQAYPKGFKANTSREVDPLIRQMAMSRDEYTCQICGATGEGVVLHAHHILSYARNKMVANDIDNVIILCRGCHNDIHHREGCTYHDARCDVIA